MLLALAPSERSPALVRDQRLLDAAASVFGCWTAALLKRDELARGRRGVERPFDEILQQQIQLARETGTELAVIVVKPGSVQPPAVRKWVRELRAQLRAVDIAVALPTGEVGIVLPSTSLGEATRVVARLRQLCGDDQGAGPVRGGARRRRQPRRTEHGRRVDADGRGADARSGARAVGRLRRPDSRRRFARQAQHQVVQALDERGRDPRPDRPPRAAPDRTARGSSRQNRGPSTSCFEPLHERVAPLISRIGLPAVTFWPADLSSRSRCVLMPCSVGHEARRRGREPIGQPHVRGAIRQGLRHAREQVLVLALFLLELPLRAS